VLIAASHAKGGITEWLEMSADNFLLWMEDLRELHGNK
jgi:hypothetical protein